MIKAVIFDMVGVIIDSDATGTQDVSMADIVINSFSEINYEKLSL